MHLAMKVFVFLIKCHQCTLCSNIDQRNPSMSATTIGKSSLGPAVGAPGTVHTSPGVKALIASSYAYKECSALEPMCHSDLCINIEVCIHIIYGTSVSKIDIDMNKTLPCCIRPLGPFQTLERIRTWRVAWFSSVLA